MLNHAEIQGSWATSLSSSTMYQASQCQPNIRGGIQDCCCSHHCEHTPTHQTAPREGAPWLGAGNTAAVQICSPPLTGYTKGLFPDSTEELVPEDGQRRRHTQLPMCFAYVSSTAQAGPELVVSERGLITWPLRSKWVIQVCATSQPRSGCSLTG